MNREFIDSRGRNPPLETRFPGVYSEDNASNIFVEKNEENVVAAVAVKRCHWRDDEGSMKIALIGGVVTDPRARGKGVMTQLLERIEGELRESGIRAAFLWAKDQDFYSRRGYSPRDRALLGSLERDSAAAVPGDEKIVVNELAFDMHNALDILRNDRRLERPLFTYRNIPMPATTSEILGASIDGRLCAFLAGGRDASTNYIFELGGSSLAYRALFVEFARRRSAETIMNCFPDSPEQHWAEELLPIRWHERNIAMVKTLDEPLAKSRLLGVEIGYLDVI